MKGLDEVERYFPIQVFKIKLLTPLMAVNQEATDTLLRSLEIIYL